MPNQPDPWYWRTGSEDIDPLQMQSAQLQAAKQRLASIPQAGDYAQAQPQAPYGGQAAVAFTVSGRGDPNMPSQQALNAAVKRSDKDMRNVHKLWNNGGKKQLNKLLADNQKRIAAIDAARNPGRQEQEQPEPQTNLQRMTQESISRGWGGVIPRRPNPPQPPTNA